MYKKSSNSLIKHMDFILLDMLCFCLAFYVAYIVRHRQFDLLSNDLYASYLFIIIILDFVVAVTCRSYKGIIHRGYSDELKKTIIHVTAVLLGLIYISFLQKETGELSRITVVSFYFFSVVLIFLERTERKRRVISKLTKKPKRQILLVTNSIRVCDLINKLNDRSVLDFSINGIVLLGEKDGFNDLSELPNENSIEDIPIVARDEHGAFDFIENNVVDELIIFGLKGKKHKIFIEKCEMIGLTVHVIIDEINSMLGDATVEKMAGVPVISSSIKLVSSSDMMLKRMLDIIGACVGLIITGISFIFVAPAILICDPGPIFFAQERIGENGRRFKIYKYRSMYMDAEKRKAELMSKNEMKGLMFKMEHDPRIIGSGEDGTKKGLGDDYIIGTTAVTPHKFLISYTIVRGVVLQFLNFKASVCCIFERKVFGFIYNIIKKRNNIKSYNDQICNSVPILI